MNRADRKALLTEMKSAHEKFREELKAEMRIILRSACHEICEVLRGQGVLEPEEKLLTKKQVMKMYGVGKTKLEDMMASGKLPFIKEGEHQQSPVKIHPADARQAFEGKR